MPYLDNDGHMLVDFGEHCPKCKHLALKENEPPCDECMEEGTNFETSKPVRWESTDAQ
jgi:hypothetical protein